MRTARLSLAILVLAVCTLPAKAGFFEDLFGGPMRAPAYNAPVYEPMPGYQWRPARRRHRAPHVTATIKKNDAKDVRADVRDDDTLRSGDAVMTAKGIRVYTGGGRFAEVSEVKGLSKDVRSNLMAINAHRNDAGWQDAPAEPSTLQTGRSAAVDTSGTNTSGTTKPRFGRDGEKVRYIGP